MPMFAQSLVIILTCASVLTAKSDTLHETYKDLILKAQNLSLQKDRLQATKILVRALTREKGASRKELIQVLKELSEVFYTDKGQQTFELGQSVKDSSLPSALDSYAEALALEPNNTSALKALARGNLALAQCDRSLDYTTQGLQINPFDDELILLKAQGGICSNKAEYSKLIQELGDLKKSNLKLHADFLKAKALILEGKLPAAEAQLDKILGQDTRFPETYYYLALLKQKQGRDAQEPLRRYVVLCSELGTEGRRKYAVEPRLCLDKAKAEVELEKLKVQTQEAS